MAININIPSQVAQTITNGVTGTAPSQDAVYDALALKENTANKGIANGYAPLNSSTKIDSTYLPSYVDDVIEVANFAVLPVTGETGKIYITIDTGLIYRQLYHPKPDLVHQLARIQYRPIYIIG